MPYLQATWENPKLTDEEAFHVAGYINSFPRPQKINKEYDYPDKKLKPMSTPYGPWKDNLVPNNINTAHILRFINFIKKNMELRKLNKLNKGVEF